MRLRIPSPTTGGSSQKGAVARATDPLLLLVYEFLDTGIVMPLTSLGWGKIAWLDAQGVSDAIEFCYRNEHTELARLLKKIRNVMRKSCAQRVTEIPLGEIIKILRPGS